LAGGFAKVIFRLGELLAKITSDNQPRRFYDQAHGSDVFDGRARSRRLFLNYLFLQVAREKAKRQAAVLLSPRAY